MKRIYLRLPNWIGDVVMAQPCLQALRQSFPEAHITVHGKAHTFGFIAATRCFDEAVPLERKKGWTWPVREGSRLRNALKPFDMAVLLPNSLSAALIALVMGAKQRYGYALNGRSFLLTKALPVKKQGRLRLIPMCEYYLKLVEAAGADIKDIPKRPILPTTEESQAFADSFFEKQGLERGEEIWAVNAGGAWITKQWQAESVAELCHKVRDRGAKVLLLGGPGEEALAAEVRKHLKVDGVYGMPEDIVGLDKLVAVLKRCQILISTDSGPRHFGVASEIPVLGLIGPTHPEYTGYDYEAMDIVCKEVHCWPCHRPICPLEGEQKRHCMTSIKADEVFQASLDLLARTQKMT